MKQRHGGTKRSPYVISKCTDFQAHASQIWQQKFIYPVPVNFLRITEKRRRELRRWDNYRITNTNSGRSLIWGITLIFILADRRNTRKARWERSLSRLRLEPGTSRILSINAPRTTFHLNQLTGLCTKIQVLRYDTPFRTFQKASVFFSTEVCSNVASSDKIQWHYVIAHLSLY